MKPFVVTGAGGATGSRVATDLLDAGAPVRALVHRDGPKAAQLHRRGADVVVGDVFDADLVAATLAGAEGAYFVYPIAAGLMSATVRFAAAARDAGVGVIVNVSQISARPNADSSAAREHWLAERVLDDSGVAVTHLRPTFFAENILFSGPRIAVDGVYATLMGAGLHAPITADDVGRVAASILLRPNGHAGAEYPLYGPREYSQPEIADAIGTMIGRTVSHHQQSVEEAGAKMGLPDPGFTAEHPRFTIGELLSGQGGRWFLVQHLEHVAQDLADGVFAGTNDVVARLTGRAPTALPDFLEARRDVFTTADTAELLS